MGKMYNGIEGILLEYLNGLKEEIKNNTSTYIVDSTGTLFRAYGIDKDNADIHVFLDTRYVIVEKKELARLQKGQNK